MKKKSMPLGFFNCLKGLGMILVIYGHSANMVAKPGELYGPGSVFSAGAMAMFFLVSGYGFIKKKPKRCNKEQVNMLLKPYAIVGISVVVTKFILAMIRHRSFYDHGFEYVTTYLFGLNAYGGGKILGLPVEFISIFWFVFGLLIGWIVLNYIMQIKNKKWHAPLVAASVIVGYLLTLISRVWIYVFPIGLIVVGYLYAGYLIRQHDLLFKKLPWYVYAILIAISAVSLCFSSIDNGCLYWKLGLYDIVAQGCLGFLIIRAYMFIRPKLKNNMVLNAIEAIGFYSIWIICVHSYEKVILPWYVLKTIFPDNPVLLVVVFLILRGIVIFCGVKGIIIFNKRFKKKKKKKPKVKLELK